MARPSAPGPAILVVLAGLLQTFLDQWASCVRGRHGLTSGYGLGFRRAGFLSVVAPKQVQQSAIPLKIVRGKTLRQAQSDHFRVKRPMSRIGGFQSFHT